MKQQQCLQSQNSLPVDVAIKIVSCLEVSDVCSLGSCSSFWRDICDSNIVWKSLCKERWPTLDLHSVPSSSQGESLDLDQPKESNSKGWKEFYVEKHGGIKRKMASLGECLSCCPIKVEIYLKALEDMKSMQLAFKDIQMLFLKPEINVLFNLIGLHYCIRHLGVQVDTLKEVISSRRIQERQISVEWCKQGGWMHRFRLPNELHFHCVHLGDLTTPGGEEVLEVLDRGITLEVMRVQICTAVCPNEHGCHLSFD